MELFMARSESDYLSRPAATPDEAAKSLSMASEFVAAARGLLEQKDPDR
jgi:hypothetical protein